MKKKYFWRRVYAGVMAIFLLALYGGVLGVGLLGWRQSLRAETQRVEAQAQYVAGQLAQTTSQYGANYRWALDALYTGLAAQQAEQDGYIAVYYNGEEAYNGLVVGLVAQAPGKEQRTERRSLLDKSSYILVSLPFEEDAAGFGLVYAADITGFVQGWRRAFVLYAVLCTLLSTAVAGALLWLLRKLSAPLGQLEQAANSLAGGRLDERVRISTNDELGRLGESFNGMADAIQQSMQRLEDAAVQKQRMVDSLAHETRTPLTAIRGYAEYLRTAPLDGEQRYEVTLRISEQATRMERISARILQLSALSPETMVLAPCPAAGLLGDTEKCILPKARAKDVRLWVQSCEGAVQGDKALLESLLLNLTDNAVKASESGGVVTLSARQEDGGITLIVEDTGRGLTAEQLARLGEPFYRADPARSRAEGGAGLGVALCFHIAALHGAALEYESTPGNGTRATVHFPVTASQQAAVTDGNNPALQ